MLVWQFICQFGIDNNFNLCENQLKATLALQFIFLQQNIIQLDGYIIGFWL